MKKLHIGLLRAIVIGAIFLSLGNFAFAAGTLAGTQIKNQAFANYKDANGNPMSQVSSNIVTTVVSQVSGVELVPDNLNTVGIPGAYSDVLAQIFNKGNGSDTYSFTITTTGNFTPTITAYYDDHESGGTMHVIDIGIDPVLSPTGGVYTTDLTSPENDYDVIMRIGVPSTAVVGDSATITLTATSKTDGTVIDVGTYNVIIAAAAIKAVKTHTPLKPAPGDTVTYVITLTNEGTQPGSTVVANDPIPNGMTYVPGSIKIGAVSKTDANDGDEANFGISTANAVTANVTSIAANSTVQISFQAKINAGVSANTAITNIAQISYLSGATPITISTNGETLFVAADEGVSLTTTVNAQTGDPGDQVVFPLVVTNSGNADDKINLTTNSSQGDVWSFYVDVDGDGKISTGDTLLVDSNGDGIIDTGDIKAGSSINILVATTIPAGSNDGLIDTTTITATSVNDSTETTSITVTTTTTAPNLSLVKTVSPTGDQPPNTVLTYTVTVTNTGKGAATSILITDPVPAHTTYVVNSIKVGPSLAGLVAQTDAQDADQARYEVNSGIIVGGASQQLGPNGVLIVQFQVKID